jgi:hypothetical protein
MNEENSANIIVAEIQKWSNIIIIDFGQKIGEPISLRLTQQYTHDEEKGKRYGLMLAYPYENGPKKISCLLLRFLGL